MKIVLYCLILFCLPIIGFCNDSLSIEVRQTNVMTGAAGKYLYNNGKIKVFRKKHNRKSYRLIACRIANRVFTELIDTAIMDLVIHYNAQSTNFANSPRFDGSSWHIIVHTKGNSMTFRVDNCYNKYFDEIIGLLNRKLKRKALILETGLMFDFKDTPCE